MGVLITHLWTADDCQLGGDGCKQTARYCRLITLSKALHWLL